VEHAAARLIEHLLRELDVVQKRYMQIAKVGLLERLGREFLLESLDGEYGERTRNRVTAAASTMVVDPDPEPKLKTWS